MEIRFAKLYAEGEQDESWAHGRVATKMLILWSVIFVLVVLSRGSLCLFAVTCLGDRIFPFYFGQADDLTISRWRSRLRLKKAR